MDLDPHPQKSSSPTVVFTGTAIGAEDVQLKIVGQIGERVVEPDPSTDRFQAEIQLVPNTLNRIVITGFFRNRRGPSRETTILQDSRGPKILLESPAEGETVTAERVSVYGRVEDASASCGLIVDFLETSALVHVDRGRGGSFSAVGARLQPDPDFPGDPTRRVLVYGGEDSLGNGTETQVRKLFLSPPNPQRLSLDIGDGDHQSGLVEEELAQALRVRLSGPGDHGNRVVTFSVSSGDGSLSSSSQGPTARVVQVRTDSSGEAAVFFLLGKTAGAGVHRVRARAAGYLPSREFIANAIPRSGLHLHQESPGVQRGEPGTRGRPLSVRVTDGRRNGVNDVDVTFRIVEGSARFVEGAREFTVPSGGESAGRNRGLARANIQFGAGGGKSRIEADFLGNTTGPVVFDLCSVKPREDGRPTLVTGVIRDRAGRPVQGLLVAIEGAGWKTRPTGVTDSQGRYRVPVQETGIAEVAVTTHDSSLGSLGTRSAPFVAVRGQSNRISEIRVPNLSGGRADTIDDGREVTLLGPKTKSRFFYIPGSVQSTDGTVPTAKSPFVIRVEEIPADQSTREMSQIARPLAVFNLLCTRTLLFDPPLSFQTRNHSGLAPGTIVDVWGIQPISGRVEVVGSGKVSEDGNRVEGNGIRQTGPVAITGRERRTTTGVGGIDVQFQLTNDPCLSGIFYNFLLDSLCSSLFDGTLQGWQSYLACVHRMTQALDQMVDNAPPSPPPPILPGGIVRSITESGVRGIFGARMLFENDVPSPPSPDRFLIVPTLLGGADAEDPGGVSFFFLDYRVDVEFSPPVAVDHLQVGDAILLDPAELEEFNHQLRRALGGDFDRSAVTITLQSISSGFAGSVLEFRIAMMFPKDQLQKTVTLNGRTAEVYPDGTFRLQGLPVSPGIPIQARVDLDFVPVDGLGEPCFTPLRFSVATQPTIGGTTDLGMLSLDAIPNEVDQIIVNPDSLELSEGNSANLGVFATRADGLEEVVTNDLDTIFVSSNPEIAQNQPDGGLLGAGGGEATITVFREGQIAITSVSVAGNQKTTTLEGRTVGGDGTPIAGAEVRILPDGVLGTSAPDGFFQVSFTPSGQGSQFLSVQADLAGEPRFHGQVDGILPILEGFTDVGNVVLTPVNSWIGNTSGHFDDGSRWSEGVVPDGNSIAYIDQPGDLTITVRTAAHVRRLVSQERIRLVFPGSLQTDEPFVLEQDLDLSGGALRRTMVVPGENPSQLDPNFGLSVLDSVDSYVPLVVDGGQTIRVENGLDLNAVAIVDASTAAALIDFRGAPQTVRGTGEILLRGPFQRARLFPREEEVTFQVPIQGEGTIGTTGSTMRFQSPVVSNLVGGTLCIIGENWTNDSSILGIDGGNLVLRGNPPVNRGEIRQVGGVLRIENEPTGNGRISIENVEWIQEGVYGNYFSFPNVESDASSSLTLQGTLDLFGGALNTDQLPLSWFLEGTIVNGALTGSSPLRVRTNPSTLDRVEIDSGFQLEIQNGVNLVVENNLDLFGAVHLDSTSNQTGLIFASEGSELNGDGTVRFGPGLLNFVAPSSGKDVILGTSITIQGGSGRIGSTLANRTINLGTVKCTTPSDRIELIDVENRGTMQTLAQSTISTLGTYRQTEGLTDNEGTLIALAGFQFDGGLVRGTGDFQGNATNKGLFSLSSSASPRIQGDYTQDPSGDLRIQIGSLSEFGALDLTGDGTFDGTLTLEFLNGFTPQIGDRIPIVTYNSSTGTFSQIIGGQVGEVIAQVQFDVGVLELVFVPN